MAFGQFNTGFQVGTKPSFGTGVSPSFSTGFSPSISTNTTTQNKKKSDNYTYNPRYPGFDEEDYKKLEQMVAAKGLTGDKKTDVMDQLYKQLYPRVLNKHKLDERQQEINNSVYQNGELLLNGNTEAKAGTGITTIAQEAKKRYNIPYNVNDQELVDSIVADTKDGNKLLYEYVNNGNPEIFYAAGIWDRPQQQSLVVNQGVRQGGVKSLVNPADNTVLPSAWELVNPVGYAAETVDNAANKFADKLMVTGESAANDLKTRLENLTPEQVEQYRQQYINMINGLEEDDDYTGWEATGDLLSALWHGTAGHLFGTEDKAYEAAARLTQSNQKEDGGYVIDKNSRLNEEDFKKWLISQEVTLGESLIGADDILKGETNPNVIRFFSNIPSSAIKTFTATVRGMTNPYDTLKGLYKVALTEEGHQAILQRYGSWEAFANAMNTDPVGVADDILSITELGANIVKGGMKAAGKVTGSQGLINAANNMPNIGSVNDAFADKLIGGGKLTYGSASNPKTIDISGLYGSMDKLAGDNKILNGLNRYVQDTSSMSKLTNDVKEGAVAAKEGLTNLKDNIVEGAAERLSGAKTSQDKLFQAQEPTLNRLSKERNTKQIRNKADVANELVVKDIKKNGGQLPTDTQSRVDAHERAMKNKWNEIETQIKDKGSYTISADKLADALDDYIKKEESYGVPTSKGDLDKLKEWSTDLRKRGDIDIVTAEGVKERINAQINDRDDKSVGNTYKNGMRKLTQEIGKAEDGALSRLPGEFQDLKNEFGALADGYGDVIKANVKAQRAKFGDSLSNFSRIKGVGEIIKGIWNGDLGEVGKGTAQAIGGEITQKIRDKDWLIEQGFKDLSAEMDAPGFKTAFQSRVGKPKGESKITSKQQKGNDKAVKNMKNKK